MRTITSLLPSFGTQKNNKQYTPKHEIPHLVAKIGFAQTKVGTMQQYQQIDIKTRNTH